MRKSIGLKIMVPFCILAIVFYIDLFKDCTDESGNQVD
jgi:hypothetical protein